MSSDDLWADARPDERGDADAEADENLAEQVELLVAENQRLRSEYVAARRSSYRRTAVGLLAVGVVALAGAVAFPDSRTVLLALGFTGLFGAVLSYFLTPERFVSAETGERVYTASARTGDLLVGELGLRDVRVYAPAPGGDDSPVRLFVPSASDYRVPDVAELAHLFVVTDDARERGVSLHPTGGLLYREFESAVADEATEAPAAAARQLADAVVEVFELAESASPDVDESGGRLAVGVTDSAYGPVDRFDHPVASLIAVGMAATLGVPVTAEVTATPDGRADYLITCEWDADATER